MSDNKSAVTIVAGDATKMGVSVLLTGKEYWFTYLDQQVADAIITTETRDEWEKKYDGYEMSWTFTNPKIPSNDQNIDAACIQGKDKDGVDYAGGGFCCGIKYIGGFSSQPQKWAIWFTTEQEKGFTAANGFAGAVDDSSNWRTEDTSFTVNWKVNRWLPKEERAAEYYVNQYRFEKGDQVAAFQYTYQADIRYQKGTATYIDLTGALSSLSAAGAVLASTFALLSF